MMLQRSRMPELLAPAGSLESLRAAVMAGADAVYLGLDEFNARRNAENFTLETLGAACEYAHLRRVLVYVTMNIEILPSEFARAVDVVRGAWLAGADAFIVQDVGLASELMRVLPQAPVHVSTQMNVHNAAGIAAAAQLGATRVTLARELSVAEIAELADLARSFGMEVECFAHGALCVCYSGQCLMSSMIGGRSANRGLCAQACRLAYDLHCADGVDPLDSPGEHLLSPKDLCTIDLLDELAEAGVASLKIEGRMKSPEYVHAVVSVYREVLDSGLPPTDEQRSRLAEAFSRGFTTAYLEGLRGNEIMSYGRPNNRGVFAGRVTRVFEGVAVVAPEIELHVGDVLEFWTNRGRFAATVRDATVDSSGCVSVAIDQRAGKGDRVFRVRNALAEFTCDEFSPRIPVDATVVLRKSRPAHIAFNSPDAYGEAEGGIVEPARTKAITEDDVRNHVDRLGQTPFVLNSMEIDLDDNVGMGFSQIHHLRTDALGVLVENMLAPYAMRSDAPPTDQPPAGNLADQPPAGNLAPRADDQPPAGNLMQGDADQPPAGNLADQPPAGTSVRELQSACADDVSRSSASRVHRQPTVSPMMVAAWATNPACARAAKRAGAEALYVPVLNFRRGQAQLAGVRQDGPEQAGYPKQCVMAMPTVDHDPIDAPVGATREAGLPFDPWDYVREGKPVFVDNLGDAVRALECGAQVEIGPHVPIVNSASLDVMAAWGVSRVWLSPELTLGQIADLAQCSRVPLGLFAVGAQELMVTEHCLLMSQGPCNGQCGTCPRRARSHFLRDRKGFDFPVVTDALGRSHLYNGVELDAVPSFPDLLDLGITCVMVDTTLMGKRESSEAVARAVRARDLAVSEHRGIPKRTGATTGHLFRGVS